MGTSEGLVPIFIALASVLRCQIQQINQSGHSSAHDLYYRGG